MSEDADPGDIPAAKGRPGSTWESLARDPAVNAYLEKIRPALDQDLGSVPVRRFAQRVAELAEVNVAFASWADGYPDQSALRAVLEEAEKQWAGRPSINPYAEVARLIDVDRLRDLLKETADEIEGVKAAITSVAPALQPPDDAANLKALAPVLGMLFVLSYPIMLETLQSDADDAIRAAAWSAALAVLVAMFRPKNPGAG